ncbi:rCG63445 [Rattus norvegicus]|uniref:RCG63445 n=1 Tax=Rattus norvegicus TaxID=10116 RepID=A6H9I1_RAT|nr:rCG63445 [Rattus norvegicus]
MLKINNKDPWVPLPREPMQPQTGIRALSCPA